MPQKKKKRTTYGDLGLGEYAAKASRAKLDAADLWWSPSSHRGERGEMADLLADTLGEFGYATPVYASQSELQAELSGADPFTSLDADIMMDSPSDPFTSLEVADVALGVLSSAGAGMDGGLLAPTLDGMAGPVVELQDLLDALQPVGLPNDGGVLEGLDV